nr:immunoglobulin light chain junction region [Macaca mulatta]
CLQDIQIPLTF